ncbi:MAG TPA: PP2C family serine/threonine-protein phosphatase [Anaerolineales bacterium]|nr:PP2C family serine/threonine-protein phosphatase [Anaerolineales bacterium]
MSFWKRLFRKGPRPSPDTVKTAPLDSGVLGQIPPVHGVRRMLIGAAQSTGIERTHNEDALFYMTGRADGQEPLPDFGLFVVADGMGGHRSGEVASSISIRTVARKITAETIVHLFDIESQNESPSLQELVQEALEEANLAVVDRVPGGGTTLTVAVLLGQQITIGHVGDSRAYLITRDEARALTRDHSLVQRLVELEQLTEEEAALHPQRNVLWNAIGQGANLKVDVFSEPVPHGGYMLVCSDGLWGTVPEADIQRIVLNAGDPQTACDQLVQAANGAGGPDNITAILIYFPAD